ncbi:lachesin-like [Mercenaria mercenaria]|uniref:lachesin-like n=1 Tax=Mercenaria mercenaria TaxID=6596 RepID=UPI00234EEDF2|nr:lachesin-like [Mercenaria mercenaria]
MDMLKLDRNRTILVLLTALLCLLTISLATESSKIRSYKILEGDNLLVICNVTDSPDIEVFWTKNDSKNSFMQQGKRLEILDIKRSYTGDYICHALNTSFPVSDYNETEVNKTVNVIHVDVQYPAEIDSFSIGPYELFENQTFTISCNMQAHPDPAWTIRNRDTGLAFMSATASAGATLTSPSARCEYMGYWECTGSNALNNGVNVTRGHNITIYCSPRPQYQKNTYVVRSTVGKHIELKMYAQAYPKANYTWSKDGGQDISNITQVDIGDETTLSFPAMSVQYFGNYTLKMQNEYGTYFAHYRIVADGAPETPTNLQFSDVTFDSVKLQWTSGFDMGSQQHFIVMKLSGNHYIQLSSWIYDNSVNHGINQSWTHVLSGLVSDTQYNLTIVSQNAAGFTSPLANPSISFRTKRIPYEKKHKVDAKLIVGVTLGTIGTVGMLAFIVYILKYRRLRTSYATMSGKKGKF